MVAIVTGVGLGLERSSAFVLGSAGQVGSSAEGSNGEAVYVNAATGNLIDQRTDEMLLGVGLNDVVSRTYNSQTGYSANGWLGNYQRKVDLTSLTGTVNTAGSTITHVAADGSNVVYTYNATLGAYVGKESNGANDTLTYASGSNTWTWKDGSSRLTEVYDGANGGRIVSATDADGNALTYTYTGALLTKVTTATTGHTEYTTLSYTGSSLTSVVTSYYDAESASTKTETRVYYGYDSANRLTSVTVDLSPNDNSTSDGKTYVTTYGYDDSAGFGTSDRITSISQTDGSYLAIGYTQVGGVYKVSQLTQTAATGVTRVTGFDYSVAGQTTITDPTGTKTVLSYDGLGQLTKKVVDPTGLNLVSQFTYDTSGRMLTASTPGSSTLTYTYDANGNWITQADSLGNTVSRTFGTSGAALNELLTQTSYTGPNAGSGASGPQTTQYVYNSANHIRFSITPAGDVTEYQYNALGQATSVIQYAASLFTGIPTLAPSAADASLTVAAGAATNLSLALSGGAASRVDVTTGPTNGTVSVSGTQIVYTPTAGYTGADTIKYTATNADGTSAIATLSLTVSNLAAGSPPAPTATNSSQSVLTNSTNDAIALWLAGGVPSSVTVSSGPTNGSISYSGNQVLYTPNPGYKGPDSFTYTVSNAGGSASATVTLTVADAAPGAPAAPTSANSSQSVLTSSSSNAISLWINGGGAPTSVSVGSATHGSVTVSNGQVLYTPTPGYTGADHFTYTVSNAGGSSSSTVSLTVANQTYVAPAAPSATNSTQTILAGASGVPIALSVAGGAATGVTLVSGPSHGTYTRNGAQVFYTPTPGYTGPDQFTYYVTNAGGSSVTRTVSLTVANQTYQPASTAPTAATASQTVAMGSSNVPLALGLSGATATGVTIVSPPTGGTVTTSGNQIFYTPNSGFTGLDYVVYQATNAAGASSNVSVAVSVVDPSQTEIIPSSFSASSNYDGSYSGLSPVSGMDDGISAFAGSSWVTQADATAYVMADLGSARTVNSIKLEDVPFGGCTTATGTLNGAVIEYSTNGTTWTSAGSVSGVVDNAYSTFSLGGVTARYIRLRLAGQSLGVGDFVIIGPIAPTTKDISTAVNAGSAGNAMPLNIGGGAATSVTVGTAPAHGSVTITGGVAYYTPTAGYSGSDSFTYTASNAKGSSSATATITVNAATPAAPSVTSVSTAVAYGSSSNPIPLNITGSTTSIAVTQPTNGSVTVVSGEAVYTPHAGFSGTDTFTYTATNAGGTSSSATVTVVVNAALAMTAPSVSNVSTVVAYGSSTNAVVLNITGSATSVTTSTPSSGTVHIVGTTITYTPNPTFSGTDSFTYTATGPGGTSTTATASIIVAGPASSVAAPTVSNVSTSVAYGSSANPVTLNITGNVTSVSATTPGHGTVNTTGATVTYTPAPGFSGTDTFTYTATGPGGVSSSATATIIVNALQAPAPPTAGPVTATVGYGSSSNQIVLNIPATATSVAVTSAPTHGTVKVVGTTVFYTPTPGYTGPDSFQYKATGPGGTSATAGTASITVAATGTTTGLTETQMAAWAAAQGTLSTVQRTDTTYDFRGNVATVTSYGADTASGAGDATATTEIARTIYVYDQAGNLLERLPAAAASGGTYSYGGTQRLPSPGSSSIYTYNASGVLTSTTGSAEVYTYDGLGRRLTSTDLTGAVTSVAIADASTTTTVTLANGLTQTSVYDKAGELVSFTQSGTGVTTSTTSYAYDADGRVTAKVEDAGSGHLNLATYYVYDKDGRQVAEVEPDGTITEYVYNGNDQVIETIAYAGKVSSTNLSALAAATPTTPVTLAAIRPTSNASDRYSWLIYDAAGRLVETIDGVGAVKIISYDGAGQVTFTINYANLLSPATLSTLKGAPPSSLTLPTSDLTNDRVLRFFYDADGHEVATLDAQGYLTQTIYDAAGRKTQTIAYATMVSAGLQSTGALSDMLASVGTSASDIHNWYVYDDRGDLRASIDGEGEVTQYHYDPLGDVDQTIVGQKMDPAALLVSAPTLAQVTALSTTAWTLDVTNTSHDLYGRVTSQTRSLAGGTLETDTYTYDNVGHLIARTTASGTADARTVAWSYDLEGNLLGTVTGLGTGALPASPTVAQVAAAVTSYGTRYAYDADGRMVSKTDAVGNRTLYFYDADSRLTYQVNAAGEVTQYVYDSFGERTDVKAYWARLSSATLSGLSGGADSAIASAVSVTAGQDSDAQTSFNAIGEVASTIDPLGATTTYGYNAFGQLVSETDPLSSGVTTQAARTYDRRGLLMTSTADVQSGGLALQASYQYDAFGRLTQVTDPAGIVTQQSYNRAGELTQKIVDAGTGKLNLTSLYGYDTRGNAVSVTDPAGITTTWSFDAFERTIVTTTPAGSTTTVKNAYGQTKAFTDELGVVTTYGYDADGNLTSTVVDPGSGHLAITTGATYDRDDRVATATDARGIVTTYAYDAASRVQTRTVDPTGLNLVTAYAYDARGNLASVTDPLGKVSRYAYDLDGQQTYAIDPLGDVTQVVYDQAGRVVETIDYATPIAAGTLGSWASQTTPVTAAQVAAAVSTNAADRIARVVYDNAGRRTWSVDGAGDVTQTSYDADGRAVAVRAYANKVAAATLTGWGTSPVTAAQVSSAISTATNDRYVRAVYDNAGRQIWSVDGVGAVTQTSYDADGRITQLRAYASKITTTGWGAQLTAAQVSGAVTAASATDEITAYVYDAAGRLAYAIDATGHVTAYVYDAAGHVLQTTQYANAITIASSYTLAYVQAQISPSSTSDRSTHLIYDNAGRETFAIDASGVITAYTYDGGGNVTKRTTYAIAYNFMGTWTAAWISNYASTHTNAADRTTRTLYDDASRAVFEVDGEGYVTKLGYDADGHVTSSTRYAASYTVTDTTTVAALTATIGSPTGAAVTGYAYDAAGQLIQVTDPMGIVTAITLNAFGQATDTTVAAGTSDASTTHVVYDNAGQMLSQTRGYGVSGVAATTTYAYDGIGRTVSIADARTNATTYAYDAAGNLLSSTDPLGASISYQYDAFHNRVKVTDQRGNNGFFYYDQLNRLVLQIDPESYATYTTYTFAGETASVTRYAARVSGTPTVTTLATALAQRVITAGSDELTSFSYDLLGRLTATTDAAGATESYGLDAFGDRLTVTNKLTAVTNNTYDRRGLLLSTTQPIKSVFGGTVTTAYQYDARGNETKLTEAKGITEQRTTNYTYDLDDRQTSTQVDTLVASQTLKYDKRGNVIESDDANGNRTLFYYDALDRKIGQVDAVGALTRWTYDGNGNVLSQKTFGDFLASLPSTPGGAPPSPVNSGNYRETDYTYDLDNRLKTTTNASVLTGSWNGSAYTTSTAAATTTLNYDKAGNLISSVDANGAVTYTYYDKLGRRIGQVDPLGYFVKWDLAQDGNVLTETRYATVLAAGFPTPPVSGAVTLPTPTTSPSTDRVTTFTYDRMGRRLTESRQNVAYASINATTGVMTSGSAAATVTYTYNALGEVTSKQEATGDTTTYVYDIEGRLSQTKGPQFTDSSGASVQSVTQEFYDGLGNVTRTTVGNAGAATRTTAYAYGYGSGARLTSTTDASGFVENNTYDAAGNLTKVSYARQLSSGSTVTEAVVYGYDADGRRVSQGTSVFKSSTWTPDQDVQQTKYDAYGDVIAQGENGLWQQTYAYDGAGHLIASNADDGSTRFYVYDKAGNETLTISSAGTDLSGYTQASALAKLTNSGANSVGAAFVAGITATIIQYDADGQTIATIQPQRETTTIGSGTTIATSQGYDAFGEVVWSVTARGNRTDYVYNTEGKLTQQQNPMVSVTAENGGVSSVRPTYNYAYDLSGRQVGSQDANGNLITRTLLAGSGYGGSDAKETAEFHPDTGVETWGYDVFGNQITFLDEIGNTQTTSALKIAYTEYRTYDAMDRVLSITHPQSSGGGHLIDYYTYDGFGQRLSHANSVNNALATPVIETTDYDSQGRVVSTVDFDYHTTAYQYSWDAGAVGIGTSAVGGWVKQALIGGALYSATETDFFGHIVATADNATTLTWDISFTYDGAGRRISQAGIGSATQSINYTYFNTGLAQSILDSSGAAPASIPGPAKPDAQFVSSLATYGYDVDGNRTAETFSRVMHAYWLYTGGVWTGADTASISYENATAVYDALGRMTAESDTGLNGTTPISITWEYDAQGNIRHMASTYHSFSDEQIISSSTSSQDYWYKYDSMNRFVLTKGTFVGTRGSGSIVRGYTGNDITYDVSGRRATETSTKSNVLDTVHTEYYSYAADDNLYEVDIAENLVGHGAASGPSNGTHVRRVTEVRDDTGRVTTHKEYKSDGTTLVYERDDTYDPASLLTQETSTTWTDSTHYSQSSSTFGYLDTNGVYMGGPVTSSNTYTSTVGQSSSYSFVTTSYKWWNGQAQQVGIDNQTDGHDYTTSFSYSANGDLIEAKVVDGRPREITYVVNATGQVMQREEFSNSGSNPMELYYYFNGVRVGDVGNNGTSQTDYGTAIGNRTANTNGAFFNGSSVQFADFDQSYDPIDPINTGEGGASTAYTVRDGDTLQSIATNAWGDGSLWYLIADANGLSASSTLAAGDTLVIPAKVTNLHNNSNTFRPYDPNLALGNVQPTTPPPPKQHCGIIGQILSALVALVASAFLGPLAANVVTQLFNMATGQQHGFSWKSLAMAFITADVVAPVVSQLPIMQTITSGSNAILGQAVENITIGAVSNGIGVATGLQSKMDWTGIAADGIETLAGGAAGKFLSNHGVTGPANSILSRSVEVLAGAGAYSLMAGTDFGTGIKTVLPDVISRSGASSPSDKDNWNSLMHWLFPDQPAAAANGSDAAAAVAAQQQAQQDAAATYTPGVATLDQSIEKYGALKFSRILDNLYSSTQDTIDDVRQLPSYLASNAKLDAITTMLAQSPIPQYGGGSNATPVETDNSPSAANAAARAGAAQTAAPPLSQSGGLAFESFATVLSPLYAGGNALNTHVYGGDIQVRIQTADGSAPLSVGIGSQLSADNNNLAYVLQYGTGSSAVFSKPIVAGYGSSIVWQVNGATINVSFPPSQPGTDPDAFIHNLAMSFGDDVYNTDQAVVSETNRIAANPLNGLDDAANVGAKLLNAVTHPQAVVQAGYEAGVHVVDAYQQAEASGTTDAFWGKVIGHLTYQAANLIGGEGAEGVDLLSAGKVFLQDSSVDALTLRGSRIGLDTAFDTVATTTPIDAKAALQSVTDRVVADLAADPSLASTVMSRGSYQHLVDGTGLAAASYGKAVERLTAQYVAEDPALADVLTYQSAPFKSTPDFFGYEGQNMTPLDITTEAAIPSHLLRPYGSYTKYVTHPGLPSGLVFPTRP